MTTAIDRINKYPRSFLNRDQNSDTGKRFQIFAIEVEELKSVFNSLASLQDYSDKFGKTLDFIGKNLFKNRDGLDDFQYKVFLSISIQKQQSKGDLYSMNQISEKILAGTGALFKISELCYEGDDLLLDGSWVLNGSRPLSGTTKQPATILIVFSGLADFMKAYPEFNRAIDDIRAGGVKAFIDYKFIIPVESGLKYIQRSDRLDGSWILDGNTTLSVPFRLNPTSIAVGNGGELVPDSPIPPEEIDMGLNSEILRKDSVNSELIDLMREYGIKILQSELIGERINELALFGTSGELLFKKTFPGKEKDNLVSLEFATQESGT